MDNYRSQQKNEGCEEPMKKAMRLVMFILRSILWISAAWIIVEIVYFKLSGEYIAYYKTWLDSARDFGEQLRVLYTVFYDNHDWFANIFTNYYIPAVLFISPIVPAIDMLSDMDKKRVAAIIIDIVAIAVLFLAWKGIII